MVRQEGLEPPLNPLQYYDVENRSDTGALIGGRYPIRTDGQLLTVAGFQDRLGSQPWHLPEVLVRGIGFEPMTKELCLPL